jgi:hypothetical protein
LISEALRTRALRVATAGWLLGWYCKVVFYVAHLREAAAWPIDLEALPSLLRAPWLAAVAYAIPLPAGVAIWMGGRTVQLVGAVALAVSAALACAHVELFNDATFVTSFWTGLWIVWLVAVSEAELARHGPRTARAVVALVFLGGAVGKLTSSYWSGDAFYHLYFLQKDTWPYPALRAAVSDSSLRAIATWFSRVVIAGELALSLGPVAPHRFYVWGACSVSVAMVLLSTFYLFSVLASLVAVLIASTWLVTERSPGEVRSRVGEPP